MSCNRGAPGVRKAHRNPAFRTQLVPATIIDGKAVAANIRAECRERVQRIVALGSPPPGLAVILVGSDPASQVYVRNKMRACADVGIRSFQFDFAPDVNPRSGTFGYVTTKSGSRSMPSSSWMTRSDCS